MKKHGHGASPYCCVDFCLWHTSTLHLTQDRFIANSGILLDAMEHFYEIVAFQKSLKTFTKDVSLINPDLFMWIRKFANASAAEYLRLVRTSFAQ